ncbi:MAG: aminopeptidase [Mogibacterium sp.]|nr:aminopeptidase [Mogibacterium sp.]MBQ6499806.1 aminopeptidase [Mogibacterium sp.]
MIHENAWTTYSAGDLKKLEDLSADYIDFLNNGKTERECVKLLVEMAKENGYRDLADVIAKGEKLSKGDKVYAVNMGKMVMLVNVGEDIVNNGMNIIGAHIDSPRLDIKQNPLYESEELAYLDTHYYGGIKKYQFVTIPLALHGVVVKKDGTTVTINIGEKEGDPVFIISDLLVHLSAEQMKKTAATVIEGENLDILVGSKPLEGEEKDAVKAAIVKLLKDKYDIEEDDFVSAEIEAVPAGNAREAGFDRSMIVGYGHDDRSCSFTAAAAMMEVSDPKTTACGLFVDKEEIGSVGATGMESRFFEYMVRELLDRMGVCSEINLSRCLRNSRMLSSDVSMAFDPLYADKYEKKNSAKLGHGLSFKKYTGVRGKSGANDANAEYLALLRQMMDKHGVVYQTSELGKVDVGGGGTIAYILSLYGMQVVDCGVPILSMHSPWETLSKSDLYEAFKGYKAFLIEG